MTYFLEKKHCLKLALEPVLFYRPINLISQFYYYKFTILIIMVNQFSSQNFFLKHTSHRYLTYGKHHVSLVSSNLRCSSTSTFPRLCPMCHQRLMHVLQRKGSLAQHIEEIQTAFSDIRLLKAFSMHVYLLNLQKLVTLLKFTRLQNFFFIKHCL